MSELQPLQPPQALEAEQSVLGALLKDNLAYRLVQSLLIDKDFYHIKHQAVYRAISALILDGRTADVVTTFETIDPKTEVTRSYLVEIAESVATSAFIVAHAEIVRDKAIARRTIEIGNELVRSAYQQKEAVSGAVSASMGQLADCLKHGRRESYITLSEAAKGVVGQIDHYRDGRLAGVLTGFKEMDRLTAGFHRKKLHLIAGRPGLGKTALAMNIAANQAESLDYRVGFFSAETDRHNFALRMLCAKAQFRALDYRGGKLTDINIREMTLAMSKMADWPFFLNDTHRIEINELKALAAELVAKERIDVVYIDYGQLVTTREKFRTRLDQVNHIIFELTDMASDLDIPVVCICQLSREMEKGKERAPRLSDLRESGNWENEARLVMALWQKTAKKNEPEPKGLAEVMILKQNDGPTGKLDLGFKKDFFLFMDISDRDEVIPVEGVDAAELPF